MRVTTSAQYVWSARQEKYIPVFFSSINWTGPVALCKGASAQQNDLAASQTQFYNTLSADYGQQFANQNNVLTTLQNTLNPIIKAGPNQFGFNAGETNTLNSQAVQGTGQQYANANRALKEGQAAVGGGNSVLPSGVQSRQQGDLATASANQASGELLGIQNAGYQQGYNTYENAIGQLSGVAGMYNPNGVAGAANNAGSAAGNELNTIQQENNAASPWGVVGGILGGATGAFTGGLGGGLGKKLGSKIGG